MLQEIDIKSKQYKIYKNLIWTVYSRIKEGNEIKRVSFSKMDLVNQKYKTTVIKNETEPFLEGEYLYKIYDRLVNTSWTNSRGNYKFTNDREDKWTVREFLYDYVEVYDTSVIKIINSQIYYPPPQNDDNSTPLPPPPPMLKITTTTFPEFSSPSSSMIIVPIPYIINSDGIRYTYSGDEIKDLNENVLQTSNFIKTPISMKIYGNSTITFYGRYRYYELEYKGKIKELKENYTFPPVGFNIDIELEETEI